MMDDDFPLTPATDWGFEVKRLMHHRGCGFDDAFTRVMARYLNDGEVQPLLDLLRHKREPNEIATKYLAAMMVPERRERLPLTNIQYEFYFSRNRKVGPPKRNEQNDPIVLVVGKILNCGIAAMAKGQKPDTSFWKFLRYAIWPRDFKTADKRIFPWKAELVRIDGSKGRRKDPKLDMRRLALAQFVQERRDQGESYEAAIQGTLEEIKKIAKAEGWGGRIGRDAIKAAYAIHRRR